MTNTGIRLLALLGLVSVSALAACSNEPLTLEAPAPVPAVAKSQGDVVAPQLYALAATKVVGPRVAISRPAAGNDAIGAPLPPVTHAFRQGIVHVAPGSTLAEVTVPVTATGGARIAVAPIGTDPVATGDALRELTVASPSGTMLSPKMLKTTGPTVLDEKHSGVWELAPSMAVGSYALRLAPSVARTGADIFVYEPSSTIELGVTPITPIVMAGTTGTVRISLLDGGKPIVGASMRAHLASVSTRNGPAVAVREIGGGIYEATVSEALDDKSASGVYTLEVHADGSSNGARFVRSGAAGFTFSVPTGRVASTRTPRLVRDGAGQITAFEADVDVEAASTDRFEVSALLTVLGPDGFEHPVAEAQTAENLEPGTHTVTLSFDAGWAQLAGADGVLHVRKLTLYSQGQQVILHRADDGFDLAFAPVKHDQLKPLAEVPGGAKAMLDLGMLQRIPIAKPNAPSTIKR